MTRGGDMGRSALGRTGRRALVGALLVLACGCTPGMRPPNEPLLDFEGPIRSRDVGEGGRVYIALCSACHRGRVNPRGYPWSPAQMRHQIRRGNEIMPPLPVEVISDAQVEAVLAYLAFSGALAGELPAAPVERPRPAPAEDAAFAGGEAEFDEEESSAHVGIEQDTGEESAQALDDPQ